MPKKAEVSSALNEVGGRVQPEDLKFLRELRFDKTRNFSTEELLRLDRILDCVTRLSFVSTREFEEGEGVGVDEINGLRRKLGLALVEKAA